MRHLSFLTVFLLAVQSILAQEHGFKFGATYRDLAIERYAPDTTAYAVVVDEFGETFFENGGDYRLIHNYHVRIKILKSEGVKLGDVTIALRKYESEIETVSEIRASSFNIVNGSMVETKLEQKSIFTERVNDDYSQKKFAIPNVKVGTVIEYSYALSSPFTYNFHPWKFQDEIPKMSSEYWANIPANYNYNISLRGYLKLTKNESEVSRACYRTADCSRLKWGMKDIPAFVEEPYMTASSNYIAAIRFELSEVQFFDGTKKKYTKEWRDAIDELRKRDDFGVQLRRGKDILDQHIALVIAGETDSLAKAKRVYEFIQGWYDWNDEFGFLSDKGIKKAFDQKTGNVADVNLSLIAALREAGFNANPVLLSTRKHGAVTELFPVLSEFNYVVASVKIKNKMYMLDATDDMLPFGLIAERCLNGKGRLIDNRESRWVDLVAGEKSKKINVVALLANAEGKLNGTITTSYFGYEASYKRAEILTAGSEEEFIKAEIKNEKNHSIEKIAIQNATDVSKPLVITSTVSLEPFDNLTGGTSLFNPFIAGKWRNPFKSKDRIYPLDYGAPREEILIFSMQIPPNIDLVDIPAKVGLLLPNGGGRFISEAKQTGNLITVSSSIAISKSFYDAHEYRYVRELYDNIVSVQNTDLVLKPVTE
ncbi:DUF3857 domain-containing protein [Pseudochryseolinea flava]|uniref:DUF3857 domain-containing protein n=1 Tax=Pseudochryseolinea flava TaxID=2059302 RepID=A0A364Y4D6_9BACT|nr:DUF3857 domain-containing protein [Pseudochryseolinea flava]RAW01802.1 DUF3857 domain-containing protein [Pseudochryseolinea flava]